MIVKLLLAAILIVSSAVIGALEACGPVCPTDDSPSTLQGTHYTTNAQITQVVQFAWDAGFTAQSDLLASTAVGVAESSLWSQARNWHPDRGCRPASDYIGVQGPDSVWNTDHSQQLHSDRGIWQINSFVWSQYNDHVTDAPAYEAGAVLEIEQGGDGRGWNQWDTYASGSAQAHYDASVDGWPALRPIVITFCNTHACT